MSRDPTEPVRVFVSYTHDSAAHKHRVAALADRLRAEGIDCELDLFEEAPREGWPAWMARQLREAKFVLVVCTARYHRRITGTEEEGIGLGAQWEGTLITQHLYETGGINEKFIPVVFERTDLAEIPDFLRRTTHYDLSDAEGYDKLYRRLTEQPSFVRRVLGSVRRLLPETLGSLEKGRSRGSGHPAPHGFTAQPLEGVLGSSPQWGSGWLRLAKPIDLQNGDRLRLKVGQTATKVVVRLLREGEDANEPVGIVGGAISVPTSRTVDIVVPAVFAHVVQISVHGGVNPWGQYALGPRNGPATLEAAYRLLG